MRLYEIASLIAVGLFAVLAFLQIIMRQQVHDARFGNEEISPWGARFSNGLLGQCGIWKLHRRAYQRSGLRFLSLAVSVALLLFVGAAVYGFFYVR
jgi:hypothetical protein